MGFFTELKRRHVVKVAIVYVTVGFAVLQGAAFLLPRMDVPDSTLNFLVALVVIGFPVALVLTWALELTPEGLRRTPKPRHGRTADERSVAVLPLANLSEDPANEYFSDGITEEILMVLSKVQSLKVISRTSVMRYKGTSLGVDEIAEKLGVAYVVEGSVRRAGDRVRITAQLIDARTDRHVWAESYDRDLEDVFAIQSDVAQAITRSLKAALTPEERERLAARPTDDPKAYEWYLEGRHLIARRTAGSVEQAIERLDKAIAADPRFALAYAARAEAYALLPALGPAGAHDPHAQARASARRALELDPGLGEAHAAIGLVAHGERNWEEAEREFRKAIELSPGNSVGLHWYGLYLLDRRRINEAMAVRERALELDPLSLPVIAGYGILLGYLRRDDEAEAAYKRGLEIEPRHATMLYNLGTHYERVGRLQDALEARELCSRVNPADVPPELVEEMAAGLRAEGPRGYWEAKARWGLRRGNPRELFNAAEALAQLGRIDEAFEVVDRLVKSDNPIIGQLWRERLLEPMRSDPRWPGVLQRAGLD